MAGLLDFLNSPEGQGLLGAGFGALASAGRGGLLNTVGAGGLAGLNAYTGAQDRITQGKRQAMQDQLIQFQLDSAKQQQAERNKALEAAEARKGYLGSVGQVTSPMVGAQPNKFDPMRWLAMGGSADEAKSLANMPNWGRSSVKDYKEVRMPDGSVKVVGFDEFGNQVQTGATPFKAPEVRDFGGYVGGIDPITGAVSNYGKKTMSDADRDASARGWANVRVQKDANNINRQAQRTQIVEGADGNVYLVDKGSGTAKTATINGTPVQAGKAAEARLARTRDAQDAVSLMSLAKELIPKATGSGIGATMDAASRYVGRTSEGAQAAARLEAIGGTLVMKMPRMEGPQSNYDQMLYREMAGKIGDRTVPPEEKMAALETVMQLQQRYAGNQPAQASSAAPAEGGGIKFLGFE